MNTRAALALCLASVSLGGCASYSARIAELDRMGVVEFQAVGKFSSTTYKTRTEGGEIVSTFEHSNAWVPRVILIRKRPLQNEAGKKP